MLLTNRECICGAGRPHRAPVNNSSAWLAAFSVVPNWAGGRGSALLECGYWRGSSLYSAASPASEGRRT